MELGVSALTRRDRLERIAAAERDRRAGRTELAIAALGEGAEWPARIVMALARLDAEEGDDARAILERSLDDWAADSALPSLDPAQEEPSRESEAPSVGSEVDELDAPIEHDELDAPIEHDELERAFSEAEAQVEEMIDVNRVAERVLMDEPDTLAAAAGDELVSIDDPILPDSHDGEALESAAFGMDVESEAALPNEGTDAAWVESGFWPESSLETEDASTIVAAGPEPSEVHGELPVGAGGRAPRGVILATLEKWLANLENSQARRAQ